MIRESPGPRRLPGQWTAFGLVGASCIPIAIAVASVFNFVANDLWTFGRVKLWLQRRG